MDYKVLSIVLIIVLVICLSVMFWMNTQLTEYAKSDDLIAANSNFQSGTPDNNLFVKYGLAGVQAVVDNVATNALNDEQLQPFFGVLGSPNHNTGASLKATLDLQLSSLLGAGWLYPGRTFTRGVSVVGRDMATSHRGLNIPDAIFTRFLNVAVVPALQQAGVSDADIAKAAPALEAMRRSIVTQT